MKMIRNRISGSGPTSPVTAAQPSTGGIAPDAPPITMFCGVAGFEQHRVDDGVADEGREREPHRQLVDVAVQQHEPEPADDPGEGERRAAT